MKNSIYPYRYNVAGIPSSLSLYVYPAPTGKIIINFPGYNSDGRGYNDKYLKIAAMLAEMQVGAVVRMANTYFEEADYPGQMIRNLQAGIEYCLRNAKKICGEKDPIIYLMGHSAGASTIAAVCAEHPEVEKILLTSLSFDVPAEEMEAGLTKFPGHIYAAYGRDDINIGVPGARWLKTTLGEPNKRLHLVGVPDCGHEFRGTTNGQIFSKASLWAFGRNRTFPSPTGGIELY